MSFINKRNLPGSDALFRSGNIGPLSYTDICWLKKERIEIFIDFRTKLEQEKSKDFLLNFFEKKIISFNNSSDSFIINNPTSEHYSNYYMLFLEKCKKEILSLFLFLAYTKKRRIIYGCSLGKDRTGVITYLLLMFMGFPYEVVKNDFDNSCFSLINCTEAQNYYRTLGKKDFQERLCATIDGFVLFHQLFQNKYKSVVEYFRYIHMNSTDMNELYKKKDCFFRGSL